MLDEVQLLALMNDSESFRVERTVSTTDTEKFREAVCAFSNDMAGSGAPGFLLVGVDDKSGKPSGLRVTDELLQKLGSYATDGTILPAPALSVQRIVLSSGAGDVAVVEVTPSRMTPVRYKGRVCIRNGPRKGIANESQEAVLIERRRAALKPFDTQPCLGSTVDDLAIDLFLSTYRTSAVAPEVIAENNRSLEHQLAALRLFDLAHGCPTHAGILLLAKDPLQWLISAYVQYVRYDGDELSDEPLEEKKFSGDLLNLLRSLDSFVRDLPSGRPVPVSTLREEVQLDYPAEALRELLLNAVMHRSYESSSPIRLYRFRTRLEIINPGPLFGDATPGNFPRQTSYRNPTVAEAMKVLGFVNQFGRGVARAQNALARNGNAPATFEFGDTFFLVTIPSRR